MSFHFQPIWPLPWVLLVIAGLVALVLTTYPPRIRHLRPGVRRLLLGMRLAAVALLALAMLRPYVTIENSADDGKTRVLYIIADSSRSMAEPDAEGSTSSKTRRQALLETLAEADDAFQQLPDNVELRYFNFAEELGKPVEELTNTTDGRVTNIDGMLRQLLTRAEGKRVLGAVLLSDGAARVADPTADPRQQAIAAAGELGDSGIRMHTLTFGKKSWTGSVGDLSVVDVTVNPANPYEGKLVSVHVTLRAVRAKGERLSAKVQVEDRTQPGAYGKLVDAPPMKTSQPKITDIVPNDHDDVIKRELTFVPPRPGKYKIAVNVGGLPDEPNTENNTLTRIINVRSGGISVAYFDRLRTEQKFLRRVNASDKIQLDYFNVRVGGRVGASNIDPEVFQGGDAAYDVFIIGDVPARSFGDDNLKGLRRRVDEGAGLLMIGGFFTFGAGGWADTPLAEVLPVKLNAAAANFTEKEKLTSELLHYKQPVQMVPTSRGLMRIVMRIAPDGRHKQLWEELELLEGANRLQVKQPPPGRGEDLIEVLATTEDGKPLLIFNEWAGGQRNNRRGRLARVMAFGADTTFQWYLGGHQDAHQRFWRQMILFLAQKDEEDRRVWARIEQGGKRHFRKGDTIPVRFGARNKDGEPVDNLNYELHVIPAVPRKEYQATGPANPELVTRLNTNAEPWQLNLKERPLPPGEYWIKVIGTRPDDDVAPEKDRPAIYGIGWERFVIQSEATDPELNNRAADPNLMQAIAEEAGGTHILQAKDFPGFIERLAQMKNEQMGQREVTLWDTWPPLNDDGDTYLPALLLLFVTLMSVEWFVRKRKGLV